MQRRNWCRLFMHKPIIYGNKIPFRSIRTFFASLCLLFSIILVVDYLVHFTLSNFKTFMSFKFDFKNAVFLRLEDWGFILLHGFITSFITGGFTLLLTLREKKRIYQVKMIRAYRKPRSKTITKYEN